MHVSTIMQSTEELRNSSQPTMLDPSSDPQQPQDVAADTPDPDMPPRKTPAGGKLRRPPSLKQRTDAEQKISHLRSHFVFSPAPQPLPATLDPALRALGLLDFARLDLSTALRLDLVAPLIAYYEPARRRSIVRGARVSVSRADLARALFLPPKPSAAAPEADAASVPAAAVMEFMHAHFLLPFQGDDACILPPEVATAEQMVREGFAHKVDWAGLMWGLVEKEMLEAPEKADGVCYYAAHLQRLIWAQKPALFEALEGGENGEVAPEASVDVEMEEEEDGDAVVKSKSLEELDSEDADVNCKSLEELESEDADVKGKSLEELGSENADVKGMSVEELESEDVDVKGKSLEELELKSDDVDEKSKSMEELESGDAAAVEAEAMVHDDDEVVALEQEEDVEVAPEEALGVAAVAPKEEVMVATPEENAVTVPPEEEAVAEEDDGKDATGLSLRIGDANACDGSMNGAGDVNVENVDGDDSDSGKEQDLEDDSYEEYKGGEEMNWRIGDDKGNEGMPHYMRRCNSSGFGSMEFENLSKGDVEMRFDDGFSGKMGSLDRMTSTDLLQAMNIPVPYNMAENVHGPSSGEFLAMGASADKNGVDLGAGGSFFFGNSGKRPIGDIDGYNGHAEAEEQFPHGNHPKRTRNGNSSSMLPGSAEFNANFAEPIQSIMTKASMFYEQKERELQNALLEKQYLTDLVQQKESIIESLNSARFDQENKWQAELRRFEHDFNVMGELLSGYKKALKQSRASFSEYRKKFPCDKHRYGDVAGGGGLVLSVKELERQRLEKQQQEFALVKGMTDKFEHEWFSKLEQWKLCVEILWRRKDELAREVDLLKEKRTAKVSALATEE